VHSGQAGIVNMPAARLMGSVSSALIVIANTYCEILKCVIKELRINLATGKIYELMQFAKMVPFTDSKEQVEQLLKGLLT
jgi:hypothetical protein